mmetsp:Transcript_52202/g.162033  ORF Transcript_52202/g.162033 Transcript_52202/m.162033 type:complete len:220 (+) Transcript_52202:569-1228(+)
MALGPLSGARRREAFCRPLRKVPAARRAPGGLARPLPRGGRGGPLPQRVAVLGAAVSGGVLLEGPALVVSRRGWGQGSRVRGRSAGRPRKHPGGGGRRPREPARASRRARGDEPGGERKPQRHMDRAHHLQEGIGERVRLRGPAAHVRRPAALRVELPLGGPRETVAPHRRHLGLPALRFPGHEVAHAFHSGVAEGSPGRAHSCRQFTRLERGGMHGFR